MTAGRGRPRKYHRRKKENTLSRPDETPVESLVKIAGQIHTLIDEMQNSYLAILVKIRADLIRARGRLLEKGNDKEDGV